LWHEKPAERLRMPGQQLAKVTPAIPCRRRCRRSSSSCEESCTALKILRARFLAPLGMTA
jgi:hypothetical protein